jgi:hypothetical protein
LVLIQDGRTVETNKILHTDLENSKAKTAITILCIDVKLAAFDMNNFDLYAHHKLV